MMVNELHLKVVTERGCTSSSSPNGSQRGEEEPYKKARFYDELRRPPSQTDAGAFSFRNSGAGGYHENQTSSHNIIDYSALFP